MSLKTELSAARDENRTLSDALNHSHGMVILWQLITAAVVVCAAGAFWFCSSKLDAAVPEPVAIEQQQGEG